MPTYVYRCHKCEAVAEELRPMADRDLPSFCPACGAESRRELFPGAAVLRNDQKAPPRGGVESAKPAIHVTETGELTVSRSSFVGMPKAISVDPGGKLKVKDTHFKGVGTAIERRRRSG